MKKLIEIFKTTFGEHYSIYILAWFLLVWGFAIVGMIVFVMEG